GWRPCGRWAWAPCRGRSSGLSSARGALGGEPPIRARRRMWPGADDAHETDTVHTVRAAPVLDDLVVPEPQDRGAVDDDALAGRRHVVVVAARVRARERPVRDDEIIDFEENLDTELHVGERRLRH